MKILVVVAHPDDEVLSAGGTLLKHKAAGDEIYIHILTNGLYSRVKDSKRLGAARQVASALEVKDLRIDKFDDQMLDTYPITRIINAIEAFSANITPSIVYTHFGWDLNKDHQITYQATITAFRKIDNDSPSKILCGEIPSSTDLGLKNFKPNFFVDISDYQDKKIELLKFYQEEIKMFPHPRSIENINNTARKWGSYIYSSAAEAFLIEREIW